MGSMPLQNRIHTVTIIHQMNLADYQNFLAELPFGKRLPDAHYVHVSTEDSLPFELRRLVEQIRSKCEIDVSFNLLKFRLKELKISFLAYPHFLRDAHPSLKQAITIDLVSGKTRRVDYSKNPNPPILHRKETFLTKDHPKHDLFKKLTDREDEAALLEQKSTIGFRLNWQRVLGEAGYEIRGHTLVEKEAEKHVCAVEPVKQRVERHRTALTRYEFSKPIKSMLEHGLIRRGDTFFDYGCGQGGDMGGLRGMGYEAQGWDPVFQPDAPKLESEVVNLGFVINVIEDPVERLETLQKAFALTRRILVVSSLIADEDIYRRFPRYQDGVLTSRNTFQKYYEQSELQQYIEDALDVSAVPLALGVFVVFRDVRDQQDFLSARSRRQLDWNAISARIGFRRPVRGLEKRKLFYEENRELLDEFWEQTLNRGRLPKDTEYERAVELKNHMQSFKRALRLLLELNGTELWEEAQENRKKDLLVYLSMANLRKRVPFKHLSDSLKADIKTHFRDYKLALKEGLELLYAAGDPDEIELACEDLEFGWQDDQALYFHTSLQESLPPILRVYVGCATLLYGDVRESDIIKLHKSSGKVTFLKYDQFDRRAFPELNLRIKVNLRTRWVNVFDHSEDGQVLCFKDRFMPPDHPQIEAMKKWSRKLRKAGLTEENIGIGPNKQVIQAALAK